jgi:hypothetical protein
LALALGISSHSCSGGGHTAITSRLRNG